MSLAWTALSDEVWVDALTLSGHGLGLSAEGRGCRGRGLPFRPFPTKFRSMTQSGGIFGMTLGVCTLLAKSASVLRNSAAVPALCPDGELADAVFLAGGCGGRA